MYMNREGNDLNSGDDRLIYHSRREKKTNMYVPARIRLTRPTRIDCPIQG